MGRSIGRASADPFFAAVFLPDSPATATVVTLQRRS